ncbi:MAG: GNAT family N-acetyltransferase [Flavisolibacter sp.]
MSEKVHFSPALPLDIPELVRLVNSAYRGDSSRQGWTTEADLLDGIRTDEASLAEMMGQPHAIILKCLDVQEQLLGCVYLQKQGKKMYLGMLTISPSLQGQGIGKQLLDAAAAYARKEGCSVVVMTVLTARTELIQWYERRGYHQTAERKPFPNDPRFGIPKQPLEFLVMERPL